MGQQFFHSNFIFFAFFIFFYLNLLFLSWLAGQPNNQGGSASNLVEACGLFADNGFHDLPCSNSLAYICEINIKS